MNERIKYLKVKSLIFSLLIMFLIAIVSAGCATSKKNQVELKGLMLLENLQLKRNKAFYSRHNMKTKRVALKKYRKNSRYL